MSNRDHSDIEVEELPANRNARPIRTEESESDDEADWPGRAEARRVKRAVC